MKGRLFFKHGYGSAVIRRSGPHQGTVLEESKELSFCAFFFFFEVEILLVTFKALFWLFAAHTSSPMRVTLADKKVCNTNTMGFGQECRSMVCGERMLFITTTYRCVHKQTGKRNKFRRDILLFKKNIDKEYARATETLGNWKPQMKVRLFCIIIKHQCEVSHPLLGCTWWYTGLYHTW